MNLDNVDMSAYGPMLEELEYIGDFSEVKGRCVDMACRHCLVRWTG